MDPGSPPADVLDPMWTGLVDENTFVTTTLTAGISAAKTPLADAVYITITTRASDSEVLQENQLQITRDLDGSFKALRHPQCPSYYTTWEELIAASKPVGYEMGDEEVGPNLELGNLSDLDLLGMAAVSDLVRNKMSELDTRDAVYGPPEDSVGSDDLAYFVGSVRAAKANLQ